MAQNLDLSLFRFINGTLSHPFLDAIMPWFSGNQVFVPAVVIAAEVKKWRYARPTVLHSERCLTTVPIDGTRLVFAGDAFGEARVEGAARSGLAAATAILDP